LVTSISSSNSSQIQELMAEMRKKMSDANTDGTDGLSKDELSSVDAGDDVGGANFLSSLQKNFDKIDSDSDGQLTDGEIEAAKPKGPPMGPPAGMFIEDMISYDTDSTTGLSKDELSAISSDDEGESNFISNLTNDFDKIDTNSDGQLAQDEIEAAKPDGPPPGPPPQMSSEDSSDDSTSSSSFNSDLLSYFTNSNSSDSTSSSSLSSNWLSYFTTQYLSSYQNNISSLTSSLDLSA